MPYLLNALYLLLLVLTAPWLAWKALRTGKYREGLRAKFLGRVPRRSGSGPCLWLHAVSVGEVNVLGPLLRRLEQEYPAWECVISTTTRTGYALARTKYAPRLVFYCPLDFSWAVRAALDRMRPNLLVLVELELWPNLIRAARCAGVKVAVVNGRLSARSARGYRRIRPFITRVLHGIDLLAVQNSEYAGRFLDLGAPPERIRVTGSVKFDGAETERQNPRTERLAALWGLRPDEPVFLAGSTQEPEEAVALETFLALAPAFPQLRLALVPRHPERFDDVAALLDRAGVRWQRRSRLESDGADPQARILLVDTVGELGAWWGTARMAYVGGSLGRRGGQNMIEPAAYGAAVSFGPNTSNFRDVVDMLLTRDAAVVVHNGRELTAFVRRCLEQPDFAAQLGQRARDLVHEQQGAAGRTCQLIAALLGITSESHGTGPAPTGERGASAP